MAAAHTAMSSQRDSLADAEPGRIAIVLLLLLLLLLLLVSQATVALAAPPSSWPKQYPL